MLTALRHLPVPDPPLEIRRRLVLLRPAAAQATRRIAELVFEGDGEVIDVRVTQSLGQRLDREVALHERHMRFAESMVGDK